MSRIFPCAGMCTMGVLAVGLLSTPRAAAQDPVLTPVVVDAATAAVPIVVKAVTPKPKPGTQKFQGYFLNGNVAEVTVKARGNDLMIQTFSLSEAAAAKMQTIIDKGGYQHGDKITVYYDTKTRKALKFKGKPSRPL